MDLRDVVRAPLLAATDDLALFAQQIFASLLRADQRRWGETYMRGLLSARGRKTVRNIAEAVASEAAVQSLQQFVSQSPWDWGAVRAQLAEYALLRFLPDAWLIQPVHIPKRGAASVGVARRFVPDAGRTMNCQLALGLLAVNADCGVAFDWRLALPPAWLTEEPRRRVGVPDDEQPRAEWEYAVEMLDEALLSWRLASSPVVIDMRAIDGVPSLVAALEQRGLEYVVRVSPGLRLTASSETATDVTGWEVLAGPTPATSTAGQLTGAANPRRYEVIAWWDAQAGTFRRSPVTTAMVRLTTPASYQPTATTRLVAIRSVTQGNPTDFLLTNLSYGQLNEALSLARLPGLRRVDVQQLVDTGLLDFEGRSFRGWHHHATLVSAAAAFARLRHESPVGRIEVEAR